MPHRIEIPPEKRPKLFIALIK